jgi:hypothetical protein
VGPHPMVNFHVQIYKTIRESRIANSLEIPP